MNYSGAKYKTELELPTTNGRNLMDKMRDRTCEIHGKGSLDKGVELLRVGTMIFQRRCIPDILKEVDYRYVRIVLTIKLNLIVKKA